MNPYQQNRGGQPPRKLDPVTAEERLDLMMLLGLVEGEAKALNNLAVDGSSRRVMVEPVDTALITHHMSANPAPPPPPPVQQAPLAVQPVGTASSGVVTAVDGTLLFSIDRSLKNIATQLEMLNDTILSMVRR